jgi:hypothetical protein
MSLDLLALSGQVREMARAAAGDVGSREDRIRAARELLAKESSDWEFWAEEIEASRKHAWLVAKPLEPMDTVHLLKERPPEYAVAASDGSQIDVDRHGIADCWVINIGTAALCYGSTPSFHATAQPSLGYRDDELAIQDRQSGREYAVTGAVLAAHRDLYEGLGLANIALGLASELPRLALQDGTLIRWTLQGFEPWLQQRFLGDYLSFFETMRALPCPLASYQSRPRSPEATGLVRYLHVRGDWDRWKRDYPRRGDNPYRGVMDHLIFHSLLGDGERSARFQSMSKINVEEYPTEHKVQFFYLKVGREIARVEFPAWVGDGDLDLVHTLIYDQCQRGAGYPVAIQRAHEQAVIHDGDRRQVEALIERVFAMEAVPTQRSAKSVSKLRPAL